MKKVNMLEAKTNLSKLVEQLESGEEDEVIVARHGKGIVKMTLLDQDLSEKRIGIAKGKFSLPDEFSDWDEEVAELFGVKK